MSRHHRREFLQEAGLGLAAVTACHLGTSAVHAAGPNERVQVGVIGPGGMGSSHLRELVGRQDVLVSHVCDVDEHRLAAAAQVVQDKTGQDVQAVKDLRKILDDKAVTRCGSLRQIIGMHRQRSWRVRPANTSTSKSRVRTIFAKGV